MLREGVYLLLGKVNEMRSGLCSLKRGHTFLYTVADKLKLLGELGIGNG